ncbi:FAD:protein FMN transferase [Psychrobacter sp. ANT_WB68]|uniref:FAD:protein FMN transferase n=1 Tax=Psychrobacter sp. ANT_WB68 TaxID=2597355 RepID=UPI0011F0BAC2|nr:FAD:protein FMN transferase [Psychrobacter sp. ANT_WB68]KAA0914519.1 FAD:protein FMN transferase [Psychrobacter sp. ANT_WB68]
MKTNMPNKNTSELATIKLFAMGCHIQINLNTTRLNPRYSQIVIDQQIALLTSDVQKRIAQWEQIFSRFDETSELMQLNNQTNQWIKVSPELFEVLQRAIHFTSKTQGLVTPTLLKELWDTGYKYSFETLPKMSMPSAPMTGSKISSNTSSNMTLNTSASLQDIPRASNDSQQIGRIQLRQLADGKHQVYLPAGMALDLNGYVKGWCAMQLAEHISHVHDWQLPCLVDMGGDIAIGVPKHRIDKPIIWGVAIAKPYFSNSEHIQEEEDVAILALSSGAVATSGQDYRRWWHDGRWQHHLIHPHYSRPVGSDILTATVLATDTLIAEVYAKYCVLLGVTEAMAWLNKHDIAALLIDTNNKVLVTSAMRPSLVQPNLVQPHLIAG